MNIKLPDQIVSINDGNIIPKEKFIDILARTLNLKTNVAHGFLEVALENAILFDKKHSAYGPHNIRKGGTFGCVLRSSDKMERLFTLFENKRKKINNESIQDNFQDISNYMIIAMLVERKKWPQQ